MRIQHTSPLGELTVPAEDGALIVARPGEAVEVPAEIAGKVPGKWSAIKGLPDYHDGRQYRSVEAGIEARDPGAGLLAQEDVWSVAGSSGKDKES